MFRVEFSRDGKTACGAVGNGGGPVATALVSLGRGTVEDDVSMSAADLERALAAGAKPPRRPRKFPVKLCKLMPWDAEKKRGTRVKTGDAEGKKTRVAVASGKVIKAS